MKVVVKNFKSCDGMDGEAFSLSLHIDGKRAAEVTNSGCGGPNDYRWLQKTPEQRKLAEAAFKEHCRSVADEEDKDYSEVEDIVLATLVDRLVEDRQLKRWCRTQILFRVEGDEEGAWRTIAAKWSERREKIRTHLRAKYGNKLAEIANERFDQAEAQC